MLFFEGNRHVGIGGEANLVSLDGRDQALGDIVMVPLVAAFAAVLHRELDPVSFNTVNRAKMDPIGADYFGVFLDL